MKSLPGIKDNFNLQMTEENGYRADNRNVDLCQVIEIIEPRKMREP